MNYDLLVAILTVIFYYHNSRIEKSKNLTKNIFSGVLPPKQASEPPFEPVVTTPINPNTNMDPVEKEFIDQTLYLLRTCLKSLYFIKDMCVHRSFSVEDMLRQPTFLPDSNVESSQHAFNLQYNLNSFNLEIVPTEKDGDCCFRSILTQLYDTLKDDKVTTKQFKAYISELNFDQNVEHDIQILRCLSIFVSLSSSPVSY